MFLEWQQGGRIRGRIDLREGFPVRLGRGAEADGRVDGDPYMSRLHVEVLLEAAGLRVRRLPVATNAVFHGGVEKEEFLLDPGESFVVGATRFRFAAETSATLPPAPVFRFADCTVLSLSVRGLPKLAEGVDGIAGLQMKLHAIMTAAADETLKEGGAVLQYLGDGIRACWNAPLPQADPVDRACRAALAVTRRVAAVDPSLDCGVGLQTGRVAAGNVGSERAFAYGVIGEAVGQAARLAELTGRLGVPALAARAVAEKLSASSGAAATPLGFFRLPGTASDLELYEISAGPAEPRRLAAFEVFETAFAAGSWESAAQALKGLPADDAAARFLSELARKYAARPPADWRGVVELSAT